jgi:toxin ParE1/3/4
MARFRLSREAESDLLGNYTLRTERQTLRNLSNLQGCFEMLADHPALGRPCEDIRPGLRRMEHGSHIVFYRQDEQGISVSRILHRRMAPDQSTMFEAD